MAKVAGAFGRSGAHDFILMRTSAVLLLVYIFYLIGYIAITDITYESWTYLFELTRTKVLTIFSLVALLVHAWIGLWQVLTDYVKNGFIRGVLRFILTSMAFLYLILGIIVMWEV